MLFSVVDDRSGAAYQEYRCVYGEDVESGLRFLFNAMAPKDDEEGPALQDIPKALYLDNGPLAKSGVFHTVMERLGVRVMTHVPAGRDGRRPWSGGANEHVCTVGPWRPGARPAAKNMALQRHLGNRPLVQLHVFAPYSENQPCSQGRCTP